MAIFRNTILKKEDFKKLSAEFPNDIELMFSSLNGMFSQLHTMLGGGLLFGDNVSAMIKTVSVPPKAFDAGQKIKFKADIGKDVEGVIVLRVTDLTAQGGSKKGSGAVTPGTGAGGLAAQQAVAADWTTTTDGVQINSFSGIDREHKYSIVVMVV